MSSKSARRQLAPTDDSVQIPAAVRALGAAAEALHAAAYAPPPADPDAPTDPVVVIEPAPAAADAAPAPTPVPAAQDSWEHKYNSMRGRYDRLEAANREQATRIDGLQNVIATMQAPPNAAPPAATSSITQEERDAFGPEFIALAEKVARDTTAPEVNELKQTVKNLTQQLENVGGRMVETDRNGMHAYLTEHCPNWLVLNDNREFIDWLALPAPYGGGIKHNLLKAAYSACDAPTVLSFFQGFLSEEAALAPRTEPAPTPAAIVAAAKVPLGEFAAPGRAKTAAAPVAPAEKPYFTRAEITQFYVDVSRKLYAGREAEKDRIEGEIHSATKEGRIR
jgi:hypothetical protein